MGCNPKTAVCYCGEAATHKARQLASHGQFIKPLISDVLDLVVKIDCLSFYPEVHLLQNASFQVGMIIGELRKNWNIYWIFCETAHKVMLSLCNLTFILIMRF